tara:strand:- start:66 stop:551 length:486 start_codon:yes stop_codon:yes gene_type:complete
MINLKITKNQLERSKKLYDFKELNNSVTKGKGNIYGAVGEIAVHDYFKSKGLDVDFNSTFDYDMIVENYKIDVKSKKTTVSPQPHFLCNIFAHNIRQKCDFYFFVSVNENMVDCHLLGYKKKEDFYKLAVFKKKGEKDINGFVFKYDCYNLKLSQLDQFRF